jgi:hypothetical protein
LSNYGVNHSKPDYYLVITMYIGHNLMQLSNYDVSFKTLLFSNYDVNQSQPDEY